MRIFSRADESWLISDFEEQSEANRFMQLRRIASFDGFWFALVIVAAIIAAFLVIGLSNIPAAQWQALLQ